MAGPGYSMAGKIISFGPFRLNAAERLLMKGEETVAIGSRAFDILITLIEQAGQVVSRDELMKRAWPGATVEEGNLRVHVSALRKALSDGQGGVRYIVNVTGRGYCFVAPVRRVPVEQAPVEQVPVEQVPVEQVPAVRAPIERIPAGRIPAERIPAERAARSLPAGSPVRLRRRRLPVRSARIIGRDETVADLVSLLKSHRFVSVVGPGGMGKTTVAVAAANILADDFDDDVFFIDLAALRDAALVATAVASALGCVIQAQDPVSGLLAFLAGRRTLLVFDNCEHVIETVAELTERLFIEAPLVHLLTTTREALRVEGENIYLLSPL
ncbi:MAG: winged helix-turn-helix domain-containing protein, partial [Dongiaceae bacterium]